MVRILFAAVDKYTGTFRQFIFPAVIFENAAPFFNNEEQIRLEIRSGRYVGLKSFKASYLLQMEKRRPRESRSRIKDTIGYSVELNN